MRVERGEGSTELKGKKLRIRLDQKEGTVYLARSDAKIKLGPVLFRAGFRPKPRDKKFLFSTVVIPEAPELLENQKTPIGSAQLARWPVSLYGCRLVWEIAGFDEEDYAAFRLRFENQNQKPVWVDELSPFSYRGAGEGLEMGAGYTVWKFYRLGYQSWSPAGAIDFQEPQRVPRMRLAKKIGLAPFFWNRQSPYVFSSEWMAEIVEPELDEAFLLGFITAKSQTGVIEAEVKYDRFRRLEAISDCEGVALSAGEELASDWVLAMLTDAPRGGQKKYYELCASAMNARKPKPITGWCSWYSCFEKIDEAHFEKNLESARRLNPGIELFLLDDGWEEEVGDWLFSSKKFQSRPEQLVQKIHGQGLKAGIWLAPFIAASGSRLHSEHKDWLLKDGRGWPVLAMVNLRWKGVLAYALDATNPEFQKWLGELIRKLVNEYKFDYLKLDFLYAGSLPGKRHNPQMTGLAALRKGLEIIRGAAGEKCYILGCGSPLLPAVGIVDAMRVSEDTDRRWKNVADFFFGIELAPAFQSCLKNDIARSLTANRLWALDPDCLLLTAGKNLKEQDLKSQLTVFYLLGGQMLLGEDLPGLSEKQLEWFSLALPVTEKPAEPIDLFDHQFPRELFLKGQPMSLLALFNWSEQAKPARINPAKYGLNGRYHLFEFWSREYLGEVQGRVEAGELAPHGVKYFALTEVKDGPQIIGLDFHLSMGGGHAEAKTSRDSSKISLSINLLGKRKGNIYIKISGQREPRILAVEFEEFFIGEM